MNTSEKEFQMIYFLINLSTVYIFQEICPITRTWRLQDIFQGLTKDLTILSLYQWLKKSYRFIFFNKKNTPAGCWQELKKFAKNWTFAKWWSWQCKINWDIFVWYSVCQLDQYIYNIETALLALKSRLRRRSKLFWMKRSSKGILNWCFFLSKLLCYVCFYQNCFVLLPHHHKMKIYGNKQSSQSRV